MPLAFTSPDSAAGARPELQQPSGAPHPSVLALVPELLPFQQRLGLDGLTSPIVLMFLPAPHAPGMFSWQGYVQVIGAAGAQMDATLSYGDEAGAQTIGELYALGGVGPQLRPAWPIFSAGLLPILVTLTFGGALGPPLVVDYTTALSQVG